MTGINIKAEEMQRKNISKKKRNYLMKSIDECKYKPQLMWKTLKAVILKSKNEVYSGVECNDRVINKEYKLAHFFNQYLVCEVINSIPRTTFNL